MGHVQSYGVISHISGVVSLDVRLETTVDGFRSYRFLMNEGLADVAVIVAESVMKFFL